MRTIQKKICLLGDFAVGKTSLIRRFVEGRFDDKYLSTIGVKISRKPMKRDDHVLKLLIWDMAGGDSYSKASSHYLRGTAGALIVCDLTREETLPMLVTYTQQLKEVNADTPIVYIGNKVDLVDERTISDEQLQALSTSQGITHLLTSAKTGDGVEDAFEKLAQLLESTS